MKPLQTERLLLRSFTQEDAARVAEICNDENIWCGTRSSLKTKRSLCSP